MTIKYDLPTERFLTYANKVGSTSLTLLQDNIKVVTALAIGLEVGVTLGYYLSKVKKPEPEKKPKVRFDSPKPKDKIKIDLAGSHWDSNYTSWSYYEITEKPVFCSKHPGNGLLQLSSGEQTCYYCLLERKNNEKTKSSTARGKS